MMHLEFGGARIPVPVGETIIGSAPGCAVMQVAHKTVAP